MHRSGARRFVCHGICVLGDRRRRQGTSNARHVATLSPRFHLHHLGAQPGQLHEHTLQRRLHCVNAQQPQLGGSGSGNGRSTLTSHLGLPSDDRKAHAQLLSRSDYGQLADKCYYRLSTLSH